MSLLLDYTDLMAIAGGSLAVLLLIYLARRRQINRISPLQAALDKIQPPLEPEQLELMLPFLVIEERFPSVGRILALVIRRRGFPVLTRNQSFTEPAQYLAQAAFSAGDEKTIGGALCHIVRGLLDDPDIEYNCRPELPELVDRFIEEIDLPEFREEGRVARPNTDSAPPGRPREEPKQ
jgi:hypothetical protein